MLTKPSHTDSGIVHAESWAHLMDQLYYDCWDPLLARFRSPYVFRGHANVAWDLTTSLLRLGSEEAEVNRVERHLLRNFRKYAHGQAQGSDSIWLWMALGQHHGLPTRLLDWTYSPFVALHFATADLTNRNEDAVIWCVNHAKTNRLLPVKLRRAMEREGSSVSTVEMLQAAANTAEGLAKLSTGDFVVFLEPPSLDARIVNQFALFSLMSRAAARLDQWLQAHPKLYRRIVIPADLKPEVRDKLDQANITERMLMPGLDGLSRWLTRYYMPRQRVAREPKAS